MPFFEDYYLWLLAKKNNLRFRNINIPLVCMRRDNCLSRRRGMAYFLHESKFYYTCFSKKLINAFFIPLCLLKVASRLLPGRLQNFQHSLPWRRKFDLSKCPELAFWLSIEAQSLPLSEACKPINLSLWLYIYSTTTVRAEITV